MFQYCIVWIVFIKLRAGIEKNISLAKSTNIKWISLRQVKIGKAIKQL